MSHKLPRFTASIYDKPLLISKQAFQEVSAYLNTRNAGLMTFPTEEKVEAPESFDMSIGIGVLSVMGPLTYRSTGWEAYCGGYSYEMLLEDAWDMISAGIKTVVMDCDSGGGEAYGCFDSADELRKMCDDNGVKLYGYVDGSACSAMYALACVCDELIANPFADVGSIGVLIALYNDSEALKKEGYERIFITDGTEKVPFAEDGSFRQEFLDDLQKRVTELGDSFRAHVTKYTSVSTQALKDTNAKVFSAQDALKIGLINSIKTKSEFIAYVMDNQGV